MKNLVILSVLFLGGVMLLSGAMIAYSIQYSSFLEGVIVILSLAELLLLMLLLFQYRIKSMSVSEIATELTKK